MKFIIKLLRLIIILILAVVATIIILNSMQSKSKMTYINLEGYALFVVDDDYLKPEFESGDVLLLQNDQEYTATVGDYIFIYDEGMNRVKRITADVGDSYKISYTNNDDEKLIKKNEVLAKVVYHSEWLTLTYAIITNWIVILGLIVFLVLSPTMLFKRYDEE